MVDLFLHPSTGDDDHNSKYVCLNLLLTIPKKYPFCFPGITIKNPRGLSDAHLASIQENLVALGREKIGSPMLYDLIEYAKECLSENNIPSCPCVICLEHFQRDENFVKTECYHYFHAACLSNYVDYFLSENRDKTIVCPMCRFEIVYNKSECDSGDNAGSAEETFVYEPDEGQLKAQAERQRVFDYQKQKGGIINIEEERNKYLIGIKDKKEEESGSNDQSSDRISDPDTKVTFGSTGLLPTAVSSLTRDQNYTGDEQYDDRRKVTSKVTKGQDNRSRIRENIRGRNGRRRDNDGHKEIQFTEQVDNGVNKDEACIAESKERVSRQGLGKERKDPTELRKNEGHRARKAQMSTGHRNESKSQFQTSGRIRGEGDKLKDSQSVDKGAPSKNESSERSAVMSEGSIKGKIGEDNNKDEIAEKNDKVTSKKDIDAGKNTREETGEVPSKEQAQEGKMKDVCKDRDNTREDERKYRTTEGRLSLSRTSAKSRVSGKNIADSGSLRQIGNKPSSNSNRKDRQRNSRSNARTTVAMRPQKNDKVPNSQRSYSSVTSGTGQSASTKRRDQTAKKGHSLVAENNNQSGNKSTKTFPGIAGKTYSNVLGSCVNSNEEIPRGSKPSKLGPPPGFENYRSRDSEALERGQMVLSTESERTAVDSSISAKPPRPAPPGFEKVKEN